MIAAKAKGGARLIEPKELLVQLKEKKLLQEKKAVKRKFLRESLWTFLVNHGIRVLNVVSSSPFAIYNGKRFKVIEMGKADHKYKVSLLIKNRRIDLLLTDVL